METENKYWKPEVGGKAWIVWASTFQFCEIRQVVVGKEIRSLGATYFDVSSQMNGGFCETKHIDSIFPTIEKAQESFEVYDLEGKEVLIPRAIHFSGICSECGSSIALDAKQTNAMTKLVEASYNMKFGGVAAIGGESDQREGGC